MPRVPARRRVHLGLKRMRLLGDLGLELRKLPLQGLKVLFGPSHVLSLLEHAPGALRRRSGTPEGGASDRIEPTTWSSNRETKNILSESLRWAIEKIAIRGFPFAPWSMRSRSIGSPSVQPFIAEVPELAGCMSDGHTYQEALGNLQTVIDEWIEIARELGRPLPEPRGRLVYA